MWGRVEGREEEGPARAEQKEERWCRRGKKVRRTGVSWKERERGSVRRRKRLSARVPWRNLPPEFRSTASGTPQATSPFPRAPSPRQRVPSGVVVTMRGRSRRGGGRTHSCPFCASSILAGSHSPT